jgi:glycosyltransferase involved in cell wall biosynthesis
MRIVHLLASPFFGGPERQVLALAEAMRGDCDTEFLSFGEGGRAEPLLRKVTAAGFTGITLRENWPHYFRAAREIAGELRNRRATILCTNGYKPDIIGLRAARLAGVPVVAIAHGWTSATWKVCINEMADRWCLRKFDAVVGVSQAQSRRLQSAGVYPTRIVTIPNAIPLRPREDEENNRQQLERMFASRPQLIVAAAGRLSPEKGLTDFVEAAACLKDELPDVGFIIFGDGPLRLSLTEQIKHRGMEHRLVLAGYREDLDQLLPAVDVLAIPSLTEGLPVILLEALRARVPVIATAVGGIPEVIEDGQEGYLIAARDTAALSSRMRKILLDPELRIRMGAAGQKKVIEEYNTGLQAERYQLLFEQLASLNVCK